MPKYECVKDFQCEVCNVRGLLQIISRDYARVRHYAGLDKASKKPMFQYHRQSKEYIEQMLRESNNSKNLDLNGQEHLDLKTLKCVSEDQKVRAGSSVRYECLTCTQEVGGSNPPQSTNIAITDSQSSQRLFCNDRHLCSLKVLFR